MYSIGDPIETVDPIDEVTKSSGTIIFLEEFANKLLIYIKYNDENLNRYTDCRFAGLYGRIVSTDL